MKIKMNKIYLYILFSLVKSIRVKNIVDAKIATGKYTFPSSSRLSCNAVDSLRDTAMLALLSFVSFKELSSSLFSRIFP